MADTFLARMVLAAGIIAAFPLAATSDELSELGEMVVTATKRGNERLQDVAVSITAIPQDRIERSGMDDFLDYAREVPGLGYQILTPTGNRDDIRGGRRLNLRGIESGYDGVPTVAFYLDDAPVSVLDPKLFDIERIEVLRGPQGTLYGANSMGGTIRIVTNKPVLNLFESRADAVLKTTRFGAASYDVNGMANAPLIEDVLGLRAVAFYRNEGGIIDNVHPGTLGAPALPTEKDTDSEESWGARLLATWQPAAGVQITPSVFHQNTKVDGSGIWDGAYRNLTVLDQNVADPQRNDFTLYGLETRWQYGRAELFSSTSYSTIGLHTVEDISRNFFNADLIAPGQTQRSIVRTDTTRLSEEIRISFRGVRWSVVAGLFYLDEDRDFNQHYPREDGSSEPEFFAGTQHNDERQLAFFSEATYKLTSKLALTAGARWFRGDQEQHVRFFSSGELDAQDGEASESAISPKAQLSYRFNSDRMAYVSATKGFRPGGVNGVVPTEACTPDLARLGLAEAPREFGSDELWSYEVGSKLSFANHRATLDAAAYFIDWMDVQQTVLLTDCGFTFLGNVGAARSKGLEVEFAVKPTERLRLSGSLGGTDAKFTKSNPDIGILEGDRLTLVPRWTAAASAQYSFTLPTGHAAYLLGDYQFHDRTLNGDGTGYLQSLDTLNMRLGVVLNNNTELALFVENLTDARPQLLAVTFRDPGPLPAEQRQLLATARPRTVGITLRYRH